MRRHQQNISFVAIISVLMGFAFFFSQQINNQPVTDEDPGASLPKVETLADIPDCSTDLEGAAKTACYTQAVTLSDQLVEAKVDAIMALEAETGNRMAFIETQSSWEESRDADCAFIAKLAEGADDEDDAKNVCLLDHNLDRVLQLKALICDYYDPSVCENSDAP
jgi:uncharacterized protein YecT (DUF1311 family)